MSEPKTTKFIMRALAVTLSSYAGKHPKGNVQPNGTEPEEPAP